MHFSTTTTTCTVLLWTKLVLGGIVIPHPNGPYTVSMSTRELQDHSRPDPLDPTQQAKSRRLMVSIFQPQGQRDSSHPGCQPATAPYMTPAVAALWDARAAALGLPNTTFSSYQISLCGNITNTTKPAGKMPLILFDPGFGNSRLEYGIKAASLASHGRLVVTVDHPYDADAVDFPDGTTIRGANLSDADPAVLDKVVAVRQRDLSFVLDELVSHAESSPTAIIAIGHSLGGAAAVRLAQVDPRVRGAINFDGQLLLPAPPATAKPIMLAGREGHSAEDPTWNATWPRLSSVYRAEVAVLNTTHASFTDLPALLGLLDLPGAAGEQLKQVVGGLSPERLDLAVDGLVEAFERVVVRTDFEAVRRLAGGMDEVEFVRGGLVGAKCGKGRLEI